LTYVDLDVNFSRFITSPRQGIVIVISLALHVVPPQKVEGVIECCLSRGTSGEASDLVHEACATFDTCGP
jgi:hypothetical protein